MDGRPLIDVHLHAARRDTIKPAWAQWVQDFGTDEVHELYNADGRVDPVRFDAMLEAEGVDIALLLAEYSPKATGIQAIEDMLPVRSTNPRRIRLAANINPHLHYPVEEELQRQLDLGAIALKVHPVHAGIAVNDRALYPAYAMCQSLGLPVIVHCGTSTFPGSMNSLADPVLLDEPLRDFPRLDFVLAHGGRGWWYDAAAFLALTNPHVWLELSGLPPSRLPQYYAKHNWNRLTRRMIFATDWPGVPGIARNARAVAGLIEDPAVVELVLSGNAVQVYHFELES